MAKNYYEILGVSKTASKDEIKRAYRKLAHEHHPDKSGGGDEKRFREANEAYEVLSDDSKRAQYDQFGQTFSGGQSASGGFGGFDGFDFSKGFGGFGQGQGGVQFDFGDIFSNIFGGGQRASRHEQGVDLEMGLEVDFLEAVFGVEKEVNIEKKMLCVTCKG